MSRKRVQRSRLNSLAEEADLRMVLKAGFAENKTPINKPKKKNYAKSKKRSSRGMQSESEIFNYDEGLYEDEELEPESLESTTRVPKALSRTSLLILDYLQFKAARCIQRYVRGWLAYNKYKKQRSACILIQTEWRRFCAKRYIFLKLETLLGDTIQKHYYQSAVRIQSVWRGWWVREHIHDHKLKVRLQVMAGEDLLHCVAFKLHHLLRTHQIPGIYSLRNSNAFSKVEKLLASLSFKHCIPPVLKAREFRDSQYRSARKTFTKSAYSTQVPFEGYNVENVCFPKCATLFSLKHADRRMSQILTMYEESTRIHPKLHKRKLKSKAKMQQICKPPPSSFCGDVVRSMKKWKIIEENKREINPNIFQRPENVEHFLKEVKSWWSLLHGNCNCRQDYVEEMAKRDLKYAQNCIRLPRSA